MPLINIGPITPAGANLNLIQTRYSIALVRHGQREEIGNATLGGATFFKPTDNIGHKSISDYAEYAGHFMYDISIPGCSAPGRVFVGQRKDGFVNSMTLARYS